MLQRFRANALAATALAVAVIGTSLAVVGLPHNSVGTKQIKKAGVHKSDLHKHAVSPSKLGTSVLRAEAFAVAKAVGAAPSNTPEVTLTSGVITTTTTGRIFGFVRGRPTVSCMSPSLVRAGLYLDNDPLAGSGFPLTNGSPAEVDLFGLTATSVTPGNHTLSLRADCLSSGFSTAQIGGDIGVGAIVLHN